MTIECLLRTNGRFLRLSCTNQPQKTLFLHILLQKVTGRDILHKTLKKERETTVKIKSLPWAILWLFLSIVGFSSHLTTVATGGSFWQVALLSFIYFTPLLAESIDDFSKIRAYDKTQHTIDKYATVVGAAYLIALTVLVILKLGSISLLDFFPEVARGAIVNGSRVVAIIAPCFFVLKKLYDLRISWNQNKNVADAYFNTAENVR